MRPSFTDRLRLGLALVTLATSGCVVSFEGYELAASGGTAGSAAAQGGGVGGTLTGGSGGSATGGVAGTPSGGSGGSGATGGAGTGGGGATGGSGGTSTGGAAGASGTGGTGGSFTCKPMAGSSQMVAITDGIAPYCIDSTEVSMKQYAAFLAMSNKPTPIGACTSNLDYGPTSCGTLFGPGDFKPVVCVDWCDAEVYCRAVGKRLCGKIGGGSVTAPAEVANASVSQWFRACSKGGTLDYPYGSVYDFGASCNSADATSIGLQPVPIATCVGGYASLYDMSGNAEEWEDDCDGSGNCAARGGSYLQLDAAVKCNAAPLYPRASVSKERGFRCCAD